MLTRSSVRVSSDLPGVCIIRLNSSNALCTRRTFLACTQALHNVGPMYHITLCGE